MRALHHPTGRYGSSLSLSLIGALLAASSLTLNTGCKPTRPIFLPPPPSAVDYDRPLPPGQLALRKITDPNEIPDFSGAMGDVESLKEAIRRSLNYMSKPSSKLFYPYGEITHAQSVASLKAFLALLESGVTGGEELNRRIRQDFDVWISVGCDDKGTVLFTGYYCPIFEASKTRTERFKYPLYSRPKDLVSDPKTGEVLGRKTAGGNVPYPSRREIEESGMLRGTELVWLGDRFEAYVVTVQGSAKLRMPDGSIFEIGYAGNNGQEYKSVGRALLRDKKLDKGSLSLQGLIDYFKSHPEDMDYYLWQNPRYVFFMARTGGPYGSLNEPVTPWRTIATDKGVFPRANVSFLVAEGFPLPGRGLELGGYRAFACDQDTGGAIRAAGRCDVFMGVGESAGQLAGRVYSEGKLYYLFTKTAPPPVLEAAPPGRPKPAS
ncbi:MAG: MltA domain-containing protein [Phycisphaerae bacterium]|nr:MltA domain-containing protein [Phycisphaerae bacterium]